MSESHDHLTHLTKAERDFIKDTVSNWHREEVLHRLERDLQTAVEIELATIPIYLYTYYSIQRTNNTGESITPADLFANKAGGVIMSVAVEEMLHMSLSSNIYYSLFKRPPQLYKRSPSSYPTGLPYHKHFGPPGPDGHRVVKIPLSKFSYEQLWHFLQIEYPEEREHGSFPPPKDRDWTTIGQFYSYIRCLICAPQIGNSDFEKGAAKFQIQPYNYAPNNIDTVHAEKKFDPWKTPGRDDSAASVAEFSNEPDSHTGESELLTISCRKHALEAIDTICDQGEGNPTWRGPESTDDPSKTEDSHYYKFLSLQAQLEEYDPDSEGIPKKRPRPPSPIKPTVTAEELSKVIVNLPDNPTSVGYLNISFEGEGRVNYRPLSDLCNGIYQYMLILTETVFMVPGPTEPDMPADKQKQKKFFNQAMHKSMIWILDGLCMTMRKHGLGNGQFLAPTWENIDLGPRKDSFATLMSLAAATEGTPFYDDISYYIGVLKTVPDVAEYWTKPPGPGLPTPEVYPFQDAPRFPTTIGGQPDGLPRHACMGLNSCKGSDRFGVSGPPDGPTPNTANECAGQGYCSTAGPGSHHSCHVLNDCKNQGGCGLYGNAKEFDTPGMNECKGLGSCATPINAERFFTAGERRGDSVWKRARAVFEKHWKETNAKKELGQPPKPFHDSGPPYLWISNDNENRGNFTACGSSGMSGAGGCS